MTLVYNKSSMLDRRRQLRQSATQAETHLWSFLRREQRLGIKFKRQYSVDGFVLDFYAPSVKLAVEVDGSVHQAEFASGRDAVRQQMIEVYGIEFLRFTNQEVLHETTAILKRIDAKIRELKSDLPYSPSPSP